MGNIKNEYIIFHKDYPVVEVELDEKYLIKKVKNIISRERLFPGLYRKQLNKSDLNDWLFSRGIPAKRCELPEILKSNGVETRYELVIRNLGLGLTDCYWIKNINDDRKWKNVNFFNNKFSDENKDVYIGNILEVKNNERKEDFKFNPNNVSSGMLPKAWQIFDGQRYMIKGSELNIIQEPFNEVIISKYLSKLGVNHVEYDLYWYKKRPYSKCSNMLKDGEELIPAYYIINKEKKDNKVTYLDHYINMCKEMGIEGNIRKSLNDMIIIDYVTANTDRHWLNFGIIRNSETLKAEKLAPLYDHGAALYAKIPTIDIPKYRVELKCQSFASNQGDNMRLVSDYALLENKNTDELTEIIDKKFDSRFIDDKRKKEILFNIKKRIQAAKKRVFGKNIRDGKKLENNKNELNKENKTVKI